MAQRVREYALAHGYARYTTTQIEAWHAWIGEITASLAAAIQLHGGVPALSADEHPDGDTVSAFAIDEARRHRSRGVTLALFLGLLTNHDAQIGTVLVPNLHGRDEFLLAATDFFLTASVAHQLRQLREVVDPESIWMKAVANATVQCQ